MTSHFRRSRVGDSQIGTPSAGIFPKRVRFLIDRRLRGDDELDMVGFSGLIRIAMMGRER
jgi:hypothetical protein